MDANLRPIDALNGARNKRILCELKGNRQIIGVLKAFDIHINLSLEDAEEHINGELTRKLGNVFIRGDSIIFVSPQ